MPFVALHGVTVAPVIEIGNVAGGVVKQISPVIAVCGDVFELVKVLEKIL
jgi:hypothetical protein